MQKSQAQIEDHFDAKVAAEEKIEPKDWMPDGYRKIIDLRHPGGDPDEIIPPLDKLPAVIGRFVDEGFSKFVLVPAEEPSDWNAELDEVAAIAKPLEN